MTELKSKPIEELKQIAVDLFKGKIFSDRHLKSLEDISTVFMCMLFMKTIPSDVGLFYEYLSEAGPISVNSLPTFMSFKMLNKEDTETMFEFYFKIKNNMENILND